MCKVLISGGGSGGHIFPAIAIAKAILKQKPEAEIKFVGAYGKMEMEKVPKAGFDIVGLWISGYQRKSSLKNLLLPLKVIFSILKSLLIILRFKPDLVIGVGGFASGPLLFVASLLGKKSAIQEQNGFPGVTNKILSGRVDHIFTSFPGMSKYFPSDKIHQFGNPVRSEILDLPTRDEALNYFGLDPSKKTVLVFGGSQGAGTLNKAMEQALPFMESLKDVQWIWQIGAYYYPTYKDCNTAQWPSVHAAEFIYQMDQAYAAADVVVCRAGALTMSELALVGKAAILVPSPNVAEDHQYKNAMVFSEADAAIVIKDNVFQDEWQDQLVELMNNDAQRKLLAQNIHEFGVHNSADQIASFLINEVQC